MTTTWLALGLNAELLVGTLLYPVASLGLTHLLRGRIQHWRALSGGAFAARVVMAVLVIGAVQTLLIGLNTIAFEGHQGFQYLSRSLPVSFMGAAMGISVWAGLYIVLSARRHRKLAAAATV